MSSLNLSQREAIRYLDGPLLVLAGAGSGKTRVITEKISYLLGPCGLKPNSVAAITFTNKAAREMRERVDRLLVGVPSKGLTISTFHSLGMRILREEGCALGLTPNFSILDSDDVFAIVAEIAGSVDKPAIRRLQSRFSQWKCALVAPDQALRSAVDDEQWAARAFATYSDTLKAYQAVDFDDLIALPVALFERDRLVRDQWQNRLRYVLVDEVQDTNAAQFKLLTLLTGARAAFTAVGDDDQAIYAWRGADLANLRGLARDYPALKVIKLEQNYRSTARILNAANALITHNEKWFEKRLWSDLGHGEPIAVTSCGDSDEEAESVIMKLQAHRFERRGAYSDYAILYRGNFQARALEKFLRNQRVPYVLSGGQSFFEKTEIKDIIAYLRLLANANDDPAFLRAVSTPRRGIGSSTLQMLGHYAGYRRLPLAIAAQEEGLSPRLQARQSAVLLSFCALIERFRTRSRHAPAAQVLPELIEAIDYEAWLNAQEDARTARTKWCNVLEFCEWLGKKGDEEHKTLTELTQAVALIGLLERQESDFDAVRLSTLHAAKGLEFKHVFLIGVEEGILPHREAQTPDRIEEERRLMYVGVTRAQRSLHLSYCEKRRQDGQVIPCQVSRFIAELGEDLHFSGGRHPYTPNKAVNAERFAALKAMLGNTAR